jgi:uncharacterized NAD-dependent epimerase/dehydratase family protein
MDLIKSFFNMVSDDQLKACVVEMKELQEIGVLASGEVRELAQQLADGTGIPVRDSLSIVQDQALKLAAFKWAGI